jgi:hypothetical protein
MFPSLPSERQMDKETISHDLLCDILKERAVAGMKICLSLNKSIYLQEKAELNGHGFT